MKVTVQNIIATEIEDDVVSRILNLYPEESLENRPVFQEAFFDGSISYKDLISECGKILIPWQFFFLTLENFNTQINHIESQRQHKVSEKLVAKRQGSGNVTSKRIIDRLIRQQNFLVENFNYPTNLFCGSLKRLRAQHAAEKILNHFEIDRDYLWKLTRKNGALEYLIRKVEEKHINVSRGVLTNKLLPAWNVVQNDIYKQTSGFVIKDECIPTLFLPSEINPDEIASRQIYTLVYLLAVIGLEQYEYFLRKDFSAKMKKAKGMDKRIYEITSELLMPDSQTSKIVGGKMTILLRDELAAKFKVTPTALITTLRIRRVISNAKYEELKPEKFVPSASKASNARSPKVSTSVKKFCGQNVYHAINGSIQNGSLKSVQAQYLIFGAVNKKGFKKYKNEVGI